MGPYEILASGGKEKAVLVASLLSLAMLAVAGIDTDSELPLIFAVAIVCNGAYVWLLELHFLQSGVMRKYAHHLGRVVKISLISLVRSPTVTNCMAFSRKI